MPLGEVIVGEQDYLKTTATLCNPVKSASHFAVEVEYSTNLTKQNTLVEHQSVTSKAAREMPSEVAESHSLSAECEEDNNNNNDQQTVISSSDDDEHESEDVDMVSAKSSNTSAESWPNGDVKPVCQPTDTPKHDDDKFLLEVAKRQVWEGKNIVLKEAVQGLGERMSSRLGHERSCIGCSDQLCTLIKEFKNKVEKPILPSADTTLQYNVLEFAHFVHSCACQYPECTIKSCRKNKDDIELQKAEFKKSSSYDVLFSKTNLFKTEQSILLEKDLELVSECELDSGAHGTVSAVHVRFPASGAEAFMALKRSKMKGRFFTETRRWYPAAREAKIHSMLPMHPNILSPSLILVNKFNGCTLILMELYDCSLHEVSAKYCEDLRTQMPVGDALFYFSQILSGVLCLHKQGIIHKDLKPKNIMVKNHGQSVAIGDFDASVIVGDGSINPTNLKGTPGFVAPEVLERKEHGKPADVYSLFRLLLALLFGLPQNENDISSMKEVNDIRRSGAKYKELADLVEKGLSLDPSERPTVMEVKESKIIKLLMKDANSLKVKVADNSVLEKFKKEGRLPLHAPVQYHETLKELPRTLP